MDTDNSHYFGHHFQEDLIKYLTFYHWYYVLGLQETKDNKNFKNLYG